MKNKLLKLITQKGDLPPLPDFLLKIQAKLKDPEVELGAVAKLIEMEPALAGNILKLANSAFYHTGFDTIESLFKAIQRLGLQRIKQLVYSLELSKLFSQSPIIDYHHFWKHALGVAIFSQSLSSRIDASRQIQDIAYLAGLMHDIGIMIFTYLVPEEYNAFLQTLSEKEEPLEAQEKRVFGLDHQEIGAIFIAKWWHVDAEIVNTVRYHHFPFKGSPHQKKCVQIVNVANGICNTHGLSIGLDCYHEVFKEGAWEALGLSLDDVESLVESVHQAMAQAMELIGYT